MMRLKIDKASNGYVTEERFSSDTVCFTASASTGNPTPSNDLVIHKDIKEVLLYVLHKMTGCSEKDAEKALDLDMRFRYE